MHSIQELHPRTKRRESAETGLSPLALVAELAVFAARCSEPADLLEGAARALHGALPHLRILVLESTNPAAAGDGAAGTGWGDVPATTLAEALASLLQPFAGRFRRRIRGVAPGGCELIELDCAAVAAFNAAVAVVPGARAIEAATLVKRAGRGSRGDVGPAVLLASSDRPPPLAEEHRHALSSVLAILDTVLASIRSRREAARSLQQIRRAKQEWEGTIDALPQIVCVLDRRRQISRANRAIETWGLGTVTSAPFGDLHALLHPHCTESACDLEHRLGTSLDGLRGEPVQQFEHDDPVLERVIRVKLGTVDPRSRSISQGDKAHFFAVIEDITREKAARRKVVRATQELQRMLEHRSLALTETNEHLRDAASELADTRMALEETRRRHRLVLENTIAGLLMVKRGRVVYCNYRFEELLGYNRGELSGVPVEQLFTPDCCAAQSSAHAGQINHARPERVCRAVRADGSTLWVRRANVDFFTEGEAVQFTTVINVTDQILAEQALHASRRELQQLSRQLLSGQEDERKRIAGDLHDGIGQSLCAVKLMLRNTKTGSAVQSGEWLAGQLDACVEKTQEMIDEVRRLSMALRPAILDSGGLLLALERLCRDQKIASPWLKIHLLADVDERDIAEPLKIHLFRIAQEAMNNTVKHADAKNLWIRLKHDDQTTTLVVRDDGEGCASSVLSGPARGLGLSSMKQRAELHDGELSVASEPGRGMRIAAVWTRPLTQDSRQPAVTVDHPVQQTQQGLR